MPNPTPALRRVNRLLLDAEREYTPQAFARALEAVEELPDQDDDEVRFRLAAIKHAMAEFRGDVAMLREATAEYERLHEGGRLYPGLAKLMPELLEDCRRQIRDGEAGRHGWKR